MKNAKLTPDIVFSNAIQQPPCYPHTGNQVIRHLKNALDIAECLQGNKLTFEQFGQLLGAPRSTVHDWYYGDLVAPIEHFLCAVERLSDVPRAELLRRLCRECPRLQHPKLDHDPKAVGSLKSLLAQQTGLTFVIGATDEVRTFVMTAVGNSALQLANSKTVCGIDVHKPDLFVPVPGVFYFKNPIDSIQVRQLIQGMWSEIENSPANLVLFNAVWNIAPEIQEKIMALSKKRCVLVADQFGSGVPQRKGGWRVPPNVVTLTSAPNHRIRLLLETLGPER